MSVNTASVSSLLKLSLGLVLVAACSSTTTTTSSNPSEPEDAGAKKTPAANTNSGNSGSSGDAGSSTDTDTPAETCKSKSTDMSSCQECCFQQETDASNWFQDEMMKCWCAPATKSDAGADAGAASSCADACKDSLCAATPSNPKDGDACTACLKGAAGQACSESVSKACVTETTCKPLVKCVQNNCASFQGK